MSVGADQFSSDAAVVLLEPREIALPSGARVEYHCQAYLQGNVSAKKGKGTRVEGLSQSPVEPDSPSRATVVRFVAGGEVFIIADGRETDDPKGLELCSKAFLAFGLAPEPEPQAEAVEAKPTSPLPQAPAKKLAKETPKEKVEREADAAKLAEVSGEPEEAKPRRRYPVKIAPAGEVVPELWWDYEKGIGTVIGRLYVWWQRADEETGRLLLLEMLADNAVIFLSTAASDEGSDKDAQGDLLSAHGDIAGGGAIGAIYVCGDVVMTEGQRTIRADEVYYDFRRRKAIAIDATMRNFDASRGIPIYVRAAKFRQLAESQFQADNATVTTSEFYVPQISINARNVLITDTTTVDEEGGKVPDSSYEAKMRDVRLKMYDTTLFRWPYVRADLERPDIPIKSVSAGHDSIWGTSVETRWHFARLLGLQEPEGTDSTLALDYYSKRGLGGGVKIDYAEENYFGNILGYVVHDSGLDRLGRNASRRDLEPPNEVRGRFEVQHRHFLPDSWQLTTEVSYLSDRNFLEQYYRNEFYTGKDQETLVHLKRIEGNQGLSLLGKVRINDVDELEQLPSAAFHWTGQSFFNDRATFYSDSQVSQFRQQLAPGSTAPVSEELSLFMSTRNEVDLPLAIGRSKVVPFVAGTVAYDDGSGFYTGIDGMPIGAEKDIWLGEAGVRASSQPYWKVYPNVSSRLWDLNQIRHIIRPHFTAVGYRPSDFVAEQRDVLNVGVTQRLQTKRGPAGQGEQRTVDWMWLDLGVTLVSNQGSTMAGPDRFIWNSPFIPLTNTYSRRVPPQDRRSSNVFGPVRDYFGADFVWRVSDTTSILSDMNLDMQSWQVQQFNIGVARLCWPNLSYYVGSRYLPRLDNGLGERGSHAFTLAATYVLDPRYTLVFSQQYDFGYGSNIRSDIAIVRRYHRMYFAIAFSSDESLDDRSVVFSLWPEGIPELGLGLGRYMGLGGSAVY
ncbi:MAG: LPS assembly protein LptD [Phycisphaerales bacterium]|nr:MAG: LPS assembly protein LptD [Phycisphaerales bacterium]